MASTGARPTAPAPSPPFLLYITDTGSPTPTKRALPCKPWSTIKDIKDSLARLLHVPTNQQLLYFGPSMPLKNCRTLADVGVYRSGETLLFDVKGRSVREWEQGGGGTSYLQSESHADSNAPGAIMLHPSLISLTPKPLARLVEQTRRGFLLNLKPEATIEGSGGTYFLRDARKGKVAVFKPADEEPYSNNNPRGYLPSYGDEGQSLRAGVIPGEACYREVAAYLLDHQQFAGVPMTTLTESRHPSFNYGGVGLTVAEGGASQGFHSVVDSVKSPGGTVRSEVRRLPMKLGSYQQFVKAECTMDDLSPSVLSLEEVQKIAILDIRLLNADRNSANLLVRRSK